VTLLTIVKLVGVEVLIFSAAIRPPASRFSPFSPLFKPWRRFSNRFNKMTWHVLRQGNLLSQLVLCIAICYAHMLPACSLKRPDILYYYAHSCHNITLW